MSFQHLLSSVGVEVGGEDTREAEGAGDEGDEEDEVALLAALMQVVPEKEEEDEELPAASAAAAAAEGGPGAKGTEARPPAAARTRRRKRQPRVARKASPPPAEREAEGSEAQAPKKSRTGRGALVDEWTEHEDALLRNALIIYGKEFGKMAKHFVRKNGVMVKARYTELGGAKGQLRRFVREHKYLLDRDLLKDRVPTLTPEQMRAIQNKQEVPYRLERPPDAADERISKAQEEDDGLGDVARILKPKSNRGRKKEKLGKLLLKMPSTARQDFVKRRVEIVLEQNRTRGDFEVWDDEAHAEIKSKTRSKTKKKRRVKGTDVHAKYAPVVRGDTLLPENASKLPWLPLKMSALQLEQHISLLPVGFLRVPSLSPGPPDGLRSSTKLATITQSEAEALVHLAKEAKEQEPEGDEVDDGEEGKVRHCRNCGGTGHNSRGCRKSKKPALAGIAMATNERKCGKCGMTGHTARDCRINVLMQQSHAAPAAAKQRRAALMEASSDEEPLESAASKLQSMSTYAEDFVRPEHESTAWEPFKRKLALAQHKSTIVRGLSCFHASWLSLPSVVDVRCSSDTNTLMALSVAEISGGQVVASFIDVSTHSSVTTTLEGVDGSDVTAYAIHASANMMAMAVRGGKKLCIYQATPTHQLVCPLQYSDIEFKLQTLSFAPSPMAKALLASHDGTVLRVWRASPQGGNASKRSMRAFRDPSAEGVDYSIVWHHTAELLASFTSSAAKVWTLRGESTSSETSLVHLRVPEGLLDANFTLRGKKLAILDRTQNLTVYDALRGNKLRTVALSANIFSQQFAFHPYDGGLVFSVDGDQCTALSITKENHGVFQMPPSFPRGPSVITKLVCAADGRVILWADRLKGGLGILRVLPGSTE